MPIQNSDLLVVQSQTDNQLYKLRIDSLDAHIQDSSGVQFRGSVDINNSASAQSPPVTLPATNGDLYILSADSSAIDSDWVMPPGVTSVSENDRIIWSSTDGYWTYITVGTDTGGTVTDITATLPLETDGDNINPVLTINEARTITASNIAGDGKGTKGAVNRLAENADVVHTTGTGATDAVVTADLLKSTNEIVVGLQSGIDGGEYAT